MSARPRIVLTGGPCGGKSALIADLLADPAWAGRVLAWPETVSFARIGGISVAEPLFERVKECQEALDARTSNAPHCQRGLELRARG
jgi:hypothetical protein